MIRDVNTLGKVKAGFQRKVCWLECFTSTFGREVTALQGAHDWHPKLLSCRETRYIATKCLAFLLTWYFYTLCQFYSLISQNFHQSLLKPACLSVSADVR